MRYGIGLDIGIASVGYAAVALNDAEEPCGILHLGVRIFDAAENPKDGASLALPRREARSARRRLRRHRHRLQRIRHLLVESGLITEDGLDALYNGQLEDVYALRTRALDTRLTNEALCRVLIHLAQRRGFRSNRKTEAEDAESGKLKTAVSENAARMQENGYRTVGEMLWKDEAFALHKRNKSEAYLSTVSRDMIAEEAALILQAQRTLGNTAVTEAFTEKYLGILLSQRSFDQGPGGDSPYGGAQIERMMGHCTFEPEEKRAPKASYSYEYFQLLQRVNHIQILQNGASRPLTQQQRKSIIALAHHSPDVNFGKIRSTLGLAEDETFNCVYYRQDRAESEKKEKLGCLKAYHEMRRALDKLAKGRIQFLTNAQRNAVAYAMTVYKTDDCITPLLAEAGIEQADIAQLLTMKGFRGTGHLSVKALDKIIPYLEQGMVYSDACTAAGYAFRGHESKEKQTFLPAAKEDMEQITSPVARRAISQTIKVVNALIRQQGESPSFVHIELAREMSRDFSERNKAEREMKQNAAVNERAMAYLKSELGVSFPTGMDLVKYKLFTEQGGFCMYSQQAFDIGRLFEPGYAEVDHIVPYSISFDDSYKNKVLVFASENRKKGNRLPLQYFSGKRQDDFTVWVNTQVRDAGKRQRLLKESVTEADRKTFKERNLQDTKTMSRFLYNYINDNLLFAPSATGRKKRVTAVNGRITAYLRKRWGIRKTRADGDMHHAMDALVIACTTDGLIARLSRYSELREAEYIHHDDAAYHVDTESGEILGTFPYPWEGFRQEWTARTSADPAAMLEALRLPFYQGMDLSAIKPIFVSRRPKHKVTGAAHKDTVRSAKRLEEGYTVLKCPLTDLKLDKDGEIADYFAPESDRLLYDALKKQLLAHGGKGENAFTQPFYKPKSDGTPGPLVKKVKLMNKTTLSVPVQGGQAVADNDSMVRIDVFHVENDGYYFVPIYVADTLKPTLPNRAVVAFKPYAEWKEMREEDFRFSLYPCDLIRAVHKKVLKLTCLNADSGLEPSYETKAEMLYYVSAGISGGTITVTNHDRSYGIPSMGIKTLVSLEKYQVDVLGNYTKVKKETRQTFR